jgi:hypothetical protein
MMVGLKRDHMPAQLDDPLTEERDLDLGRARVRRMDPVLGDELVFFFFRQHFISFSFKSLIS